MQEYRELKMANKYANFYVPMGIGLYFGMPTIKPMNSIVLQGFIEKRVGIQE